MDKLGKYPEVVFVLTERAEDQLRQNRLRQVLVETVCQLLMEPLEEFQRKKLIYRYTILQQLIFVGVVSKSHLGVELIETHKKSFSMTQFLHAWHSVEILLT